jgi:hypothetical protein
MKLHIIAPLVGFLACSGCNLTGRPTAAQDAEISALSGAYIRCTLQKANQLSYSDEPAETVAIAAVGACGKESADHMQAVRDAMGPSMALRASASLERISTKNLVSFVIEQRQKRRSG